MRGTADLYSYDDAEIELLDLTTGTRHRLIEGRHRPHLRSDRTHVVRKRRRPARRAVRPAQGRADGSDRGDARWDHDPVTTPELRTTPSRRQGISPMCPVGRRYSKASWCFVDRSGEVDPSGLENALYDNVAVSPSGRKLAFEISAANENIWVHDLDRGASTRLTTAWDNESPVWTSDDQRSPLPYGDAGGCGRRQRCRRSSRGRKQPTRALDRERLPDVMGASWATARLWAGRRHLDSGSERRTRTGVVSSDAVRRDSCELHARWPLAGVCFDESERYEVYVVPYPTKDKRWQVSVGGGESPRWSFDERELYYMQGQTMMVVDVETSPEFSVSPPRPLFELDPRYDYSPSFDVFPDGRFAMIRAEKERRSTLRVVLHWLDGLRDQE